ncbi:MAG: insulinase family protein [Muribaculaceae bacterium]|nr:insulinase family protein [Muribaculaceae bacterium]
MKRYLRAGLMMLAAFFAFSSAKAQMPQMPPIPVDSAVTVGKLDNGLTYYIRHNNTPKGQVDFYIAQKVGSILEEENQRGLAHFLEHMCFNGSENFPGNSLINWLESVGVKFGYNLNAYTDVDETVYRINNVPAVRPGVVDSCLLVLHDWACALTLDPDEIDSERKVIHEEWRQAMVGEMRVIEKLLPVIYPESRYGERLPIGTMEVVDNFPYQALVDYYHTWYRPDQQGIVVVGDIDPAVIEAKIKDIFGSIKMPENAKEREYYQVEDTPGTIFAIGSDPEVRSASFDIMFKVDPLIPREYRNTSAYFPVNYMKSVVTAMLQSRLSELAKNPTAEFSQPGVGLGRFFVSVTKEALSVEGSSKEDDIVPAIKAVYREILRAVRGGFTVGEYERARAEFLSRMERLYENRNNTESSTYGQEYVRSFIDNDPIPGIATEYEIYKQIAPMVPLEAINQLLPQIVNEDNRVLFVLLPENGKTIIPTEDQLEAALSEVDEETLEPYKDQMKEEPLIPSLPAPGKIVSTGELTQWDATEWTLSNGVKVIVKPTKFKDNEIAVYAFAKGGLSVLGEHKASTVKFLPYSMLQHGLGDYTSVDIQKYLQGKQVSANLELGDYTRAFAGKTTVKDLPTLMELLYMNFADFEITPDEFAATQNMITGALKNQESTPNFIFSKKVTDVIYKSANKKLISTADIAAAEREETLRIIHAMLADASDFTFVFVGNINLDVLRPLVEQYIATLPTGGSNIDNVVYKAEIEPALGSATDQFTTKMETPQTFVYLSVLGSMPYEHRNKVLASVAGQILSNRLLKKVREEMGAVYSIGMQGDMDRLGNANTVLVTSFPMKPELKDETLEVIRGIITSMTENVTDDELNPIKEYMAKNAVSDLEDNDVWGASIGGWLLNGVDTFNGRAELVNSLTPEDVKEFMRKLLDQNNYRVIVLDPEVAE